MEINNLELVSVVEDIPLEYLRRNNYTKCLEIYNARAFNWSDGVYGRWDNLNIIPEVFASKCKKWALNNGYMMKIENHYSNSIQIQIRKIMANSVYKEPWQKTFKNEVEGIIEVTEWILKELKNENT